MVICQARKEGALACASHTGEDFHRDIVRKWLTWIGLSNDDLECGAALGRESSKEEIGFLEEISAY